MLGVTRRRILPAFVACALFALVPCTADALVNINTADEAALTTLTGIGPTKAAAIVAYRQTHGLFATIEDIQNVSGIGPSTFAGIKDFITVADAASAIPQTQPASDQVATSTATTTPSQARTQPVSSYVPPPVPKIFADAGDDRTVIVGADTEFDARAYDRQQTVLDSSNTRFMWNFGDGVTAEGPAVLHHFSYPGRYAVVLIIAHDKSAGNDEVIVTAESAALSFRAMPDGSVAIGNDAGHDLDLSGWLVKQALESLTLPEHSMLLAGETLRIPHATLGFYAIADAELDYPNGVRAFAAGEESGATSTPSVSAQTAVVPATASASLPVVARITPDPAPAPAKSKPVSAQATSTAAAAQVAGAAEASFSSLAWWLAAGGLGAAAFLALVASKRFAKNEWNITEI